MHRGYSGRARRGSSQNWRGSPFSPHVSQAHFGDMLPAERLLQEGLVPHALQTISTSNLTAGTSSTDIQLTDFEYLASYNWLDETSPTILIPGSPPIWANRSLPYQVPFDTVVIVDQHGYRIPEYKLLPLIVAVEEHHDSQTEPFPWNSIDIVTDRNNLRKLFKWVNRANANPEEFRIDLHLAGGHTVLMNRWHKQDRERGSGCRFNFERASTRYPPGYERSVSHHRIVRYNMNGLSMVVRFDVDACYPAEAPHTLSTDDTSVDDLVGALAGVNIGAPLNAAETANVSGISVRRGGTLVPQSSLIELTTRSGANREFYDWRVSYPQSFLSEISNHILAIHRRGRFEVVEERRLSSGDRGQLQTEFQDRFKKLHSLLKFIRELVISHGRSGALTLVCEGHELRVYQRVVQASCLPDEYLARF
ncbi:hypothetical protein BDN72DRAFT_788324, partial [Pluteus cervinus]